MSAAPRRRGFTLVEVLVGLFIVALGMSALLQALGSAADSTAYLRAKLLAQWVGLNRLVEVRLQTGIPATGNSEGDVADFAGRKWHYKQKVEATQIKGMVRIEISVREADAKEADSSYAGTVIGIAGDAIRPPVDLDFWGIPGSQQLPQGFPPQVPASGPGPGGLGSGLDSGSSSLGGGNGLGSDLPATGAPPPDAPPGDNPPEGNP